MTDERGMYAMDIADNKSIRTGIIIFIVTVVIMAALIFAFKNANVSKFHPTVRSFFKWHPTYSEEALDNKMAKPKPKQQQQDRLEEEKHQIEEERHNLELEKQELANRESQLEQRQLEIEATERELAALQDELEEKLQNVKNLAQYYELMETRSAAKILENTDDEFIIQLLSQMKKETASEILSNFDPKKAAAITQKMGGL